MREKGLIRNMLWIVEMINDIITIVFLASSVSKPAVRLVLGKFDGLAVRDWRQEGLVFKIARLNDLAAIFRLPPTSRRSHNRLAGTS